MLILIRKTTAIWLFQETERISADRLFRVRLKQLFASVTTGNVLATQTCQKKGDTKDVIVISREAECTEICCKTKDWAHIGKYKLTLAEKEIIINGQWLNDLHINAVQHLVKRTDCRIYCSVSVNYIQVNAERITANFAYQ